MVVWWSALSPQSKIPVSSLSLGPFCMFVLPQTVLWLKPPIVSKTIKLSREGMQVCILSLFYLCAGFWGGLVTCPECNLPFAQHPMSLMP